MDGGRGGKDLREMYIVFKLTVQSILIFTRTCRKSVCLSVCHLSSVGLTLVHPTQRIEPFGNISSLLCTLAIL